MELTNKEIVELKSYIASECWDDIDGWDNEKANEMAREGGFKSYFALKFKAKGIEYAALPQETKDKIQAAKVRKQERRDKRKESAKKAAATRKANAKKKAEEKAKVKAETEADLLAQLLAQNAALLDLVKKNVG